MSSPWNSLSPEIRLYVLQDLLRDGYPMSRVVTVSREWQAEIERRNFSRIKLTLARLDDFRVMVQRNRDVVKYIWFCLELDEYDCRLCSACPFRSLQANADDERRVTTEFRKLISTLSVWDHHGQLTLDISVYSPSDSRHWFKYLTNEPDAPFDMTVSHAVEKSRSEGDFTDTHHGRVDGYRQSTPSLGAIRKIFNTVLDDGPFGDDPINHCWWNRLPYVPAVTTILLRQQSRRQWRPESLAHMFARFPNLQEIHHEPWRERCMCANCQRWTDETCLVDAETQYLLESMARCNRSLKKLVIFENFNQQYPIFIQKVIHGVDHSARENFRNPSPDIALMLVLTSPNFETLAASFITDASYFFRVEPDMEWPNLKSIVLTSRLFTPDVDSGKIQEMLQAAANAAARMPRLETMEVWNGRKGLAALFRYQAFPKFQRAAITWRATWELALGLDFVREHLEETDIKSHGDALQHLELRTEAIRPISVQQIQREQMAMEGIDTV
ncbi:hypothetical protein F5X68DRAFT_142244 [Plectosphaerella plurivora]|uniref:DUF6546 domain-containing protein n=1 Tax=Plectosphaerella plurivora TaxID=936078 RepID=A0A9P8V2M9_9PEZI|nr:hypothetical protein F5X68DRAFT_142244 [Plectosphaerella plurivora]